MKIAVILMMLATSLFAHDTYKFRDGATSKVSTLKTNRFTTAITFEGNYSQTLVTSRHVSIFNTTSSLVSMSIEARAPNGKFYYIEDFNDEAMLTINANSVKSVPDIAPYYEIRLVITGGANGLYVVGAD